MQPFKYFSVLWIYRNSGIVVYMRSVSGHLVWRSVDLSLLGSVILLFAVSADITALHPSRAFFEHKRRIFTTTHPLHCFPSSSPPKSLPVFRYALLHCTGVFMLSVSLLCTNVSFSFPPSLISFSNFSWIFTSSHGRCWLPFSPFSPTAVPEMITCC